MIRKLIAVICVLAISFCMGCSKNNEDESLPESVENSDLSLFLQAVQKVEEADNFYTVAEGVTKTLTVNQKIKSKRYVIGNTMFKESISCSGIVKVATQVYVANGKYLVRDNQKVSSVNDVEWQNTAMDVGETEYLNRYGSVILGLNNYVVNEQTITGISLVENQDEYEFTVVLNVENATVNIAKEMKTNAKSKSEPTFISVEMVVKTDKNLVVKSVDYECEYQIDIAILGEVKCNEQITEYYYGFNQTETFPEWEFFKDYV